MRQEKKMESYSAERKEKALAEEVADFVLRILPLPDWQTFGMFTN